MEYTYPNPQPSKDNSPTNGPRPMEEKGGRLYRRLLSWWLVRWLL